MDTPTTFGLRFDQLAEILSVGMDDVDSKVADDAPVETAKALDRQLRTPLPSDSILLKSVLETMGRLGCDTRSLAGRSLIDVLLDEKTDLALLQTIKDHAKHVISGSIARTQISVATAIYYAAIASGLVYHNKKITGYASDKLCESLTTLEGKSWMAPEFVALYAKARAHCNTGGSDA